MKAEFEIKRSWSGPVRGNDAFSRCCCGNDVRSELEERV